MIQQLPESLQAQKVWGVVSTWSVDVLYDGLTYAEALAFAERESKREGQHCKVVLVVHEMDGPPMPKVKLRPRRDY